MLIKNKASYKSKNRMLHLLENLSQIQSVTFINFNPQSNFEKKNEDI